MKIHFLGATGTVVPSCYLLECNRSGMKVLVDCGTDNGGESSLLDVLPCRPGDLDHILLTHAHLDHVGALPLLCRHGFRGKVRASKPTREIARISLVDAVEHEQRRRGEKARWSVEDVHQAMRLFDASSDADETSLVGRRVQLRDDVFALFERSSHIVGACQVRVSWRDPHRRGRERSILFSGDIGNNAGVHEVTPWLRPTKAAFEQSDYAVEESTYGGTRRPAHEMDRHARRANLATCLAKALQRGGPITIPTFAIGRLQDLLFDLHCIAFEDPALLADVDVVVVGTMGLRVNRVYAEAMAETVLTASGCRVPVWRSKETAAAFYLDEHQEHEIVADLARTMLLPDYSPDRVKWPAHLLGFGRIWRRSSYDKIDLRPVERRRAIIIAGGGMGEGAVQRLLKEVLPDERASVFFCGYCEPGTVGGTLLALPSSLEERERKRGKLRLRTAEVALPFAGINAHIEKLWGYSAHADLDGLVNWCFAAHPARSDVQPVARRVFITHGENPARRSLRDALMKRGLELASPIAVECPSRVGVAYDLDHDC